MGIDKPHITQTQTTIRWQRTSTTIRSRDTQWYSVDLAIRCEMERHPETISSVSNLSSSSSILCAQWNNAHDLRTPCQKPSRAWQVRPFRVFYRLNFYSGEKGGFGVGKTKRGKGTKLMAVADGAGIPLAFHATSAAPHEVTLVHYTLKERFLRQRPVRLIGDSACDCDPLGHSFAQQGNELIAPHKFNRIKPTTQDGRVLYRYIRRWKIERLFAWFQNYRHLLVRNEYHLDNIFGFVHLSCILILIKTFF